MNSVDFQLRGVVLRVLPSGALWDPVAGLLCVSDLHLGRADRVARHAGPLLPPYEGLATLDRLSADVAATDPRRVICLGDSFDDPDGARSLDADCRDLLLRMQAGRDWIWIEGNHDPGPLDIGGRHRIEEVHGPLTFRHIARTGALGEVSGHYHPKLALPGSGAARRCVLFDADRCILPAYGAYTGGLSATAPVLRSLLADRAFAVLTGRRALLVPLPALQTVRRPPRPALLRR